jgi:Zn-dependent peptidase ImmA (M78 family)
MTTFDRGFKSWSERISIVLRRELELAPHDALPPSQLAEYLDAELWTPRDVSGLPKDVIDQLLHRDPWGWSAVSLLLDGRGIVIFNPRKSKGRQASDITHELAHFILDHQPGTIILSPDGDIAMRTFDRKQEDEANWLAWCILLPRDALVWAKLAGLTTPQIAERYGVTETLAMFRLNMSGVHKQFRRKRIRAT